MEESAARQWLIDEYDVPRGTMDRIESFVALLREENGRQNLVSSASLDHIWSRHIVDSAQLLRFAPDCGTWLDLGTGAGFPGLIVALLWNGRVTMVEQRRLRVDFLARASSLLGIEDRSSVICANANRLSLPPFDVISARAFAPLDRLLALGTPFATLETRWVLPKGRNAKTELEAARASWQGEFRLEPSRTDPDAFIIVAHQVRRKSKGKRAP